MKLLFENKRYILSILLTTLMVFCTCLSGYADPVADGICRVGDMLAPGESCTYPTTDTEFSVNANGNGQFLFFSSGSRLNIRNTQINNTSYTLVAEKLASGSWEIQELGAEAPPEETEAPPEEPEAPPVITGPWLWMIAPTAVGQGGAKSTNVDSLSEVSGGLVTEADIAVNGAVPGSPVDRLVWTLGEISATANNNVNELINRIGFATGDVNDHSVYGLITLESATAQRDVVMQAGSDDSIKIWLNGEVVHNNPVNRAVSSFQDTFTVDLVAGDNLLLVKVSEWVGNWNLFVGIEAEVNAVYKLPQMSVDINGDGVVNVADLVIVASSFGETVAPGTTPNPADVNGDGVVDRADILSVIKVLEAAAAPALSEASLHHWIAEAKRHHLDDPTFEKGIAVLEQFLEAVRPKPKETLLLSNYPNPFNPETWIPYRLSKDTDVTLTIYNEQGAMVRTLMLGHQPAGHYESRSRAAYWNGRNQHGEPVASGIYFYTLTAGDYIATRKLLIRK